MRWRPSPSRLIVSTGKTDIRTCAQSVDVSDETKKWSIIIVALLSADTTGLRKGRWVWHATNATVVHRGFWAVRRVCSKFVHGTLPLLYVYVSYAYTHTLKDVNLSLRAYVMRSGQESFHVGFCARDRCARAVILWIRVTPDRYIITASRVVARGTGKKTRVASVRVRGGKRGAALLFDP